MIKMLYKCFQHWSASGSVYLISDTHFDDSDCKLMEPGWISPKEHIKIINEKVKKADYLIHLGDVGNPEWLNEIKCKNRVLIMGNHDVSKTKYEPYFKEIYSGPVFIAEKILLSHEPIKGLEGVCLNIHGHDHGNTMLRYIEENRINIASNVFPIKFNPINLKSLIEAGYVNKVKGIHRETIDYAIENSLRGTEQIEARIITHLSEIRSDEIAMYLPCDIRYLAIKRTNKSKLMGKCPICNSSIYITDKGILGHISEEE